MPSLEECEKIHGDPEGFIAVLAQTSAAHTRGEASDTPSPFDAEKCLGTRPDLGTLATGQYLILTIEGEI